MNAKHKELIRAMATLLVAIPLLSCSSPTQPTQNETPPTPTISSTPTGAVEVLPTPTPAALTQPSPALPAETLPVVTPPIETVPVPDIEWTQETYGAAWTIGYPAGWTVNAAGANEGALQLQGDYEGHSYAVTYSYPIGILADSLDAWVEEVLLPLTLEQRKAVVTNDLIVANSPAKKVLNVPTADGTSLAHYLYLWRSETKNQRLITITQTDGQPTDALAMDQLLDRLLVPVR